MNFYIAFFLPSILGLSFYSYLKKENNTVGLVLNYFLLTLLSNMVTMLFLVVRNTIREGVSLMTHIDYSFAFGVKYMLLTMVVSVVIGVVLYIINKYCSFSIEVINGKNKKK